MKQIILKLDGGIIDPVAIPDCIEIVIMDYDMTNSVDNELIQTDNTGKEYVEIVFESTECV
jgi:hypothetical protein